MSKISKTIWLSAALGLLLLAAFSTLALSRLNINRSVTAHDAPLANLTGKWKGDDGAVYYVRQVGNEIWWVGRGNGFDNVFYGKINQNVPDRFSGRWADVPMGGGANNYGSVQITIASQSRLVLMGEPGNFAAREWTR